MAEGGTFASWAGAVAALIIILLVIPEFISKIVAELLGIIPAILAALGLTVKIFTDTVLKTELSDGWQYIWDVSKFYFFTHKFVYWTMSFGRLIDWGFPFIFPVSGDPNPYDGCEAGGFGESLIKMPCNAAHK